MLDGLNKFTRATSDISIKRSRFDRDSSYKTTFKAGDLVPVFLDEVLPGDTFNLKTAFVLRQYTPVVPVLDNAFIDFYYFFVPNRIIAPWNGDDWEEIMGENKESFWSPSVEKTVTLTTLDTPVTNHSVANYLGIPIGADLTRSEINPYPFIAYAMIYDEWFRDQNTQSPILTKGYDKDAYLAGMCTTCLKANKFHDLFTSCLPSPQKGDSVEIGIAGTAPVSGTIGLDTQQNVNFQYHYPLSVHDNLNWQTISSVGLRVFKNYNSQIGVVGEQGSKNEVDDTPAGVINGTNLIGSTAAGGSLVADLSAATAMTINQLRNAFAIQRVLEKDARGGSRYREILKSHFGVTIGDARVQIPEYLGGKRIPINVSQVLQSSSSTEDSPLGFTGAYSLTGSNDNSFVKSFTEHGYIIGIAVVRTMQSYSQGIPKLFSRFRRFDYYLPAFANLGEQPIYKDELFYNSSDGAYDPTSENRAVFGYQEAWAHYRYKPSLITGSLSPNANDLSFGAFTYTNDFSVAPTLNSDFMKQSKTVVDKTLVATTDDQYLLDCYFKLNCVREMPVESIPGLIDHH